MKEIKVDCPCCEAKLVIDVRTSTVIRHALPDRVDEFGKPLQDQGRWDAAVDKVARSRSRTGGEDAFDSALRKEQSRSRDLDDLFDRARSKVDRRKKDLEDE